MAVAVGCSVLRLERCTPAAPQFSEPMGSLMAKLTDNDHSSCAGRLAGVCFFHADGAGNRRRSKKSRRQRFAAGPGPVRRRVRPMLARLPFRPDSFAFVANGQGYVKSEAVLRIARELPRWRWTWVFHLIPRVIRDAIYDLVARNRYRWFGRRDTCILPNADRSWPS
jgi:predicted DCC family thiol-disulfide oxidoreductase YuxK